MNIVLIDTNVVLDYAEERKGFFESAEKIFTQMRQGSFAGFVSSSAVTDIYFFLRKHYKSSETALSLLIKLLEVLGVLLVDRETIDAAVESGVGL